MKNKTTEKKKVSPTLRSMNVGEVESFPKERYLTVLSSIQRIRTQLGFRFSTNQKGETIEVTRIA